MTRQLYEDGIDTLFVGEDGKTFVVFRYSWTSICEEYRFNDIEKLLDFLTKEYRASKYYAWKEDEA